MRILAKLIVLALPLAGCGGTPSETAAREPVRVESPGLMLAIAALPEPFAVAVNEGERLELTADGGRVRFAVGPRMAAGINLVEEVKRRRAEFEAAPSGEYLGNRELMTPIGTAFTARGSYATAEGAVEETWIYAVHPAANRLLSLTYSYPVGEAEARVPGLMALLGEVGPLVGDEDAGAAASDG